MLEKCQSYRLRHAETPGAVDYGEGGLKNPVGSALFHGPVSWPGFMSQFHV